MSVNTSRPLRNPFLHRARFSFSFRPLAETLSHLLWGKQRFGELISWQGYAALLNSGAASALLPTPALERKKKNPLERKTEGKKGREAKRTKALSLDGQTIRQNIRVEKSMWKQTCLYCCRLLKWGLQLYISHHNDFLSREFSGNNIINNQAEANCLGKHFSLSAAHYISLQRLWSHCSAMRWLKA